ncbi:MAG: hypothetical protein WCT04_25685 [Planctomycetota bacterium]
MRILIFIVSVLGLVASARAAEEPKPKVLTFPVNREPVEVDNSFDHLNPFYKQRSGAYYDIHYVSPAATRLFDLARIRPEQMVGTLDSLRAFVFDYLDFTVRGDGKITEAQRQECMIRMDGRFKTLLDEFQYKVYQIWRDDSTGSVNALAFIMRSPPEIPPNKAPLVKAK